MSAGRQRSRRAAWMNALSCATAARCRARRTYFAPASCPASGTLRSAALM
jgi:hypothetical protein